MGLCKNREELAQYATKNDVQSLTGLFLESADCDPCNKPEEDQETVTAVGIGSVIFQNSSDDGNQEPIPTSIWGRKNWGRENIPAAEFIENLMIPPSLKGKFIELMIYEMGDEGIPDDFPGKAALEAHGIDTLGDIPKTQSDLVAINNIGKATANQILRLISEDYVVKRLLDAVPGNFRYNPENSTATDIRYARLIRRLDLTEWITIPNSAILYCVVTDREGKNPDIPLGQTTVWVKANALIHHSRVKTAKSFVRGEIARRMRNMDFDPDLEGLMKVFFDVDAEDAYSSNRGNCS